MVFLQQFRIDVHATAIYSHVSRRRSIPNYRSVFLFITRMRFDEDRDRDGSAFPVPQSD